MSPETRILVSILQLSVTSFSLVEAVRSQISRLVLKLVNVQSFYVVENKVTETTKRYHTEHKFTLSFRLLFTSGDSIYTLNKLRDVNVESTLLNV